MHHVHEQLTCADKEIAALVSHIQVNPLADTLLKRTLKHVCAREGVTTTDDELNALATLSSGDLRNALHSLQFMGAGATRQLASAGLAKRGSKRARAKPLTAAASSSHAASALAPASSERDRFPDMFRTFGSILNRAAKREKMRAEAARTSELKVANPAQEQRNTQFPVLSCGSSSSDGGGSGGGGPQHSGMDVPAGLGVASAIVEDPGTAARARAPADQPAVDADYSPEGVIERSAFGASSAAAFLHQNYTEHFTDIGELAEAAACLSDAGVFAEARDKRPSSHAPLLAYVASIAGRGVIVHNQHPLVQRKFGDGAIRKPEVYAVERVMNERRQHTVSAFHRAANSNEPLSRLCSSTELTTDLVPFLALMHCGPLAHSHSLQWLSGEQWQLMSELSGFDGHRALPRLQASATPHYVAAVQPSSASPPTSLLDDDDIEEDQ